MTTPTPSETPTPRTDDLVVKLHKQGYHCERNGDFILLDHAKMIERENQRLREALTKINRIRNSIVAHQSCNFSEHVYPLVAALNEAGIPGMPYPEALAYFGPVTERAAKAELKLDQWQKCAAELAKRLTFVAPRDGDNFAYLQDEQALSIFNKLNTNE